MIITVKVVANPTNDLIDRIVDFQWRGDPQRKNCMRTDAFDLEESPTFHVVAAYTDGTVVGHLFCIRNDDDPSYWYYGDLAVRTDCRRQGIAEEMVKTALEHIRDLGGVRVCCFFDEANAASMSLQYKLGFELRPAQPFNLLDTGDELMMVKDLPHTYDVLELDENGAIFPTVLYRNNRAALHGETIGFAEFREMLQNEDTDERNFLICDRGAPRAWLKVNGLDDAERAWISMLAVDPRHHREGVGTFAVKYAEDLFCSREKTFAAIHTTADNTAAMALYRKCGYTLVEKKPHICTDGTKTTEITFEKCLI